MTQYGLKLTFPLHKENWLSFIFNYGIQDSPPHKVSLEISESVCVVCVCMCMCTHF